RLQMAMWIGAAAILANAQSSAGTKTFARNQLKGPAETDLARRLAIRCAASGIEKTSTDAEIQAVVNTMIAELIA
ncbi:MAG: hypothetical protein IPK42_24780, partial [Betaproteobacteria bacterium]|nr:hypothetical protein [Betaproteobacteria bacterium]